MKYKSEAIAKAAMKRKSAFSQWKQRFRDAWLIFLSGEWSPDIHEDAGQAAFVKWFELEFGSGPNKKRLCTNPNERRCSFLEGERLNAMGRSTGVPDVFIPGYFLYLEFKQNEKSPISAAQLSWHDYLRTEGYSVLVVYGAKDAREKFMKFLSEGDPTKPKFPH